MPLNIVNFNPDDIFQRGLAFHRAGRLQEAEACYRQVLSAQPEYAACMNNLGVILIESGRLEEALDVLLRAHRLNPRDANVCNAIGEAYRGCRDGDNALAWYTKALQIDPNLTSAYNNRGIVEAITGRMGHAVEAWRAAIDILKNRPGSQRDQSLTYNNIGNAFLEQGDVARAIENHKRAHELAPADPVFHSNFLRDWTHSDAISPAEMRGLHEEWWKLHGRDAPPIQHPAGGDPGKRLRVGLVSPDFREHSVTYFLMGLLENYDRNAMELVGYGNVVSPDGYTQWVAERLGAWRNICGMPADQAAGVIRQDGIDILIDLAGHTAKHRLDVFAWKPAPVQVAYLGYPMTTGAPREVIGWRLTDALADPQGLTDAHFTEKLWRLDRPAWCYKPPVAVAEGREGTVFTFGSFNSFAKVTDRMIGLWAKILLQVPGAQLLLKAMALRDEAVAEAVRGRFLKEGVGSERLIFSGKQATTAEHLAQYRRVDVALDTFPYHGTTTTCEALWMGVPVVTLAGQTHVSRVGVSLLTAVGLEGLVARDEGSYEALAARLATLPEVLKAAREGLRGRMEGSELMDSVGFARAFEGAMRGIWRDYLSGGPGK